MVVYSSHIQYPTVLTGHSMPTRVKRVNGKRSKTVNLCTNFTKVGKRRRMDFG